MSDKVVLSPVIADHTIQITDKSLIDFTLNIRQVDSNGVKRMVQLTNGVSNDVKTFVALFDDNDIDFEIVVDNRSVAKNMRLNLIYGKKYKFVVIKGQRMALKALESSGHHLRFLSPNLPMAQLVVDLVANGIDKWPGIDRPKAEMICSRIQFKLEVEKSAPIVQLLGPVIQLSAQPLFGNRIDFAIGLDNTIHDMKVIIEDRVGIRTSRFRLHDSWGRLLVPEDRTVGHYTTLYGIESGETLHMQLELFGGGDGRESMASPPNHMRAPEVMSPTVQAFGRRGVVGFGRQTDEYFTSLRK
ncbi:unnamed protein product [Medioppia subpectinata]|uniref:Ubiquitin-like domain-containing protein n=1 Tax=Medioppia subpectinata TaxID=1979941 RepID=A0A7R9QEH9_9ACAR|nr:unnamed protein product [Medioppia subpectinata]CAG2118924.1 unnamed protein product [Medioppia subpectinata]